MPPEPTFSYDLLKRLLKEHPDWSYTQYAKVLTQEKRERLGPRASVVLPNTIASAISRHRYEWEDEGMSVPDNRVPIYRDLVPWRLPEQYRMDTYIRKLRTIARMRRGVPPEEIDPRDARQALAFEAELRSSKRVVDVTARGRPFLRDALPQELDANGELIDVVAQASPGKNPFPRVAVNPPRGKS